MQTLQLGPVPEWLAVALVTAALAALGFIGKQVHEWIVTVNAARRTRRARLVTLLSLLNGTAAVRRVQDELRDRLFKAVTGRAPGSSERTGSGYEAALAAAFPDMSNEQKQLHSVIRGYTLHGLRPLNEAMSQWLQADTEFKLARARTRILPGRRRVYSELASQLAALEPHLLMWLAKCAVWMPGTREHALVYLADEEKHGVPFPHHIERTIERALGIAVTPHNALHLPTAAEEKRRVSEAETV